MKYPTKTELEAMTTTQQAEAFAEMAHSLMSEKGIRWSQACLMIKQRYPAARKVWGAPAKWAGERT